jgi:hypothetical protein
MWKFRCIVAHPCNARTRDGSARHHPNLWPRVRRLSPGSSHLVGVSLARVVDEEIAGLVLRLWFTSARSIAGAGST